MRLAKKYFTEIFTLILCVLLVAVTNSVAAEELVLRASIMETDITNEIMIIAEKDVHLLAKKINGKKIWTTAFFDTQGNTIGAETFQKGDMVVVRGRENSNGSIEAVEITKLVEKKLSPQNATDLNAENSRVKKPAPPEFRQEKGVWKN